ncbi:MAG TPA: hypothetical protein ENI60_03105 [Candidatus Fraserbacteria bacterium]|nr:hypothetical protein [Candidatus Fraserbacteria bacterium]
MGSKRQIKHRLIILFAVLAMAILVLLGGQSASKAGGASDEVVIQIPASQLARVNYIVINGNALGDSAEGTDATADMLVKLGVVWDTADIGVFTGSKMIVQKSRPLGDLKGLFTIRVLNSLLEQEGGVLLSFGAYSHEVYIGKVLNESLTFLLPTNDGSPFTTETIETAQIGAVKLAGGGVVQAIFKLDGSVDDTPRILISPLQIQLSAGAAITGRLLAKKFQFELSDANSCPAAEKSNPCVLDAEQVFIIDLGENGAPDRILLREPPKAPEQSAGKGPGQPPSSPEPGSTTGGTQPLPPPDFSPRPPIVGQTVQFQYPDPDCQPSPEKPCPPAKVITIEDKTKVIKGWAWSFGDGESSTEAQPAHSYNQSKVYQACVTLTLDDDSQIKDRCTQVDVWLEGQWRTEDLKLELSVWDRQGNTWTHRSVPLERSSIDYVLIHEQVTPALGAPVIVCPVFCF